MSEFQLYAEEFTEADQGNLVGFSCGSSVSGRLCTEWICGSDVLDSMKRGTKVWLYHNEAGELIGYGSIGLTSWRWPLPDGGYTSLILVPMLGIDQRFQGKPPDKQWRYSHQIMKHLIYNAHEINRQRKNPIDRMVLMVDPENQSGIRLYEQFDFALIPNVTRGAGQRVMQHLLASDDS